MDNKLEKKKIIYEHDPRDLLKYLRFKYLK